MNKRHVSVIIPCRNGADYLAEAVRSVQRQNMPLEIIVVDDGSTDGTATLAASLGCKVISIPHSGPAAARNAGLKTAQGEYILFFDHDDVMTDGALLRLLSAFLKDTDFVSAKVHDFVSLELSKEDKEQLAPRPEPYSGLLTGAYLFKRQVFEKVGGFDEKFRTGECIDFLLRCAKAGLRERKLNYVASGRRLHNTNMGRTMRKQENKDYSFLLREKIRGGGVTARLIRRFLSDFVVRSIKIRTVGIEDRRCVR
ncbi:MAG: glycosyltransferase [Desulfovibrio sp.]|jgi:glycosyltransferase involved in cell wall biosynthesis|nr:glycosyltransferase [Desulfovibrio sp.]